MQSLPGGFLCPGAPSAQGRCAAAAAEAVAAAAALAAAGEGLRLAKVIMTRMVPVGPRLLAALLGQAVHPARTRSSLLWKPEGCNPGSHGD